MSRQQMSTPNGTASKTDYTQPMATTTFVLAPDHGVTATSTQRRLIASALWGRVQFAESLAPGASIYTTASHGGIVAALPAYPRTPQWHTFIDALADAGMIDSFYHVHIRGRRNKRMLLASQYSIGSTLPDGRVLIGEEDADLPMVFLVLQALGVNIDYSVFCHDDTKELTAYFRQQCKLNHEELLVALDAATLS